MTASTTTASRPLPTALLTGALLLGISGDLLLRDSGLPGLGLFLWVVLLALAATGLRHLAPDTRHGQASWLITAAGFASCIAIRASETLTVLNILAIGAAFVLAALPWVIPQPSRARVRDVVTAGVLTGLNAVAGLFAALADLDWAFMRRKGARTTSRVIAGLVIAVPVVAVFSMLFASADPVFGAFMQTLFDWNLGDIAGHVVISIAFAWISAGLLRSWLKPPASWAEVRNNVPEPTVGATTATIVVGAMAGVFLLFVAIQARYFFGGAATVADIAGLSIAEYARQGFFQMVAASGLVIPVLYVADAFVPRDDARALHNLRLLGGLQLALTLLVGASAVSRLALYIGTFGLTLDRVIASAVLVWLGATIVIFAATVLRGRNDRFSYRTIVAGFSTLAALNAVNPEALVARVNLSRGGAMEADTAYLLRLSPDAALVLVAHQGRLTSNERCVLKQALTPARPADWRSWNLARARAVDAARTLESCTR